MSVKLPNYPLDPNYGSGVFRRAVRLTNREGEAYGELEDEMHCMRCAVRHDGDRIIAIESNFERLPMSTCGGADAPIQELVGQPLGIGMEWFYGGGRPRLNCTHLYDLVWWTISYAARCTPGVRHYEAEIPDAALGVPANIRLLCDGKLLLNWTVIDGVIQAPPFAAGRHILGGFAAFARSVLEGDDLKAALVLSKAYFVSGARRLNRSQMVGPLRGREDALRGSCWTFQSPQFEKAVRQNTWRDFTRTPDDLLA